jgi:hypothetical protein
MMVVVLCCGRLSPIFPTSLAHQFLFLLLFPLLIFLRTPKQSLDLQHDVQKGLLFLNTFNCPIYKFDISGTSWSHSSQFPSLSLSRKDHLDLLFGEALR